MNKYKVRVDYITFVFDEGEAALAFAEVAKGHVVGDAGVTIEIGDAGVTIEIEEVEEDGR